MASSSSMILKRRSSDILNNKFKLFHQTFLRSSATTASDCFLPETGVRHFSDVSQTRSLSQVMDRLMKSNPITNNTASQGISGMLNDAKELNNSRMMHNMAGLGLGKGESGKEVAAAAVAAVGVVATRRYSTSNLRPLSPHLPVYKPQSSSMSSIFHRISFMYLAGVTSFYYLIYLKMGSICLTYDSFNSVLYYTSKLNPILLQMSALSVMYQIFHWFQHLGDSGSVSLGGIGHRLTRLMKFK
ncbi:hypothetical protein AQUCO_04500162v1 [Aquilegia coerulea]|uniref:Succinate dehydrogenase subunit 3 n=1 Tax=Aquilegia coerulea TaxID=218851 RepID=A0A2G5CM83_AQUCA|nr:hypothetical protein AQUCO_04500162v1 [Aquilegia coerulea]